MEEEGGHLEKMAGGAASVPQWRLVGCCCSVCHGLIALRPTLLFTCAHLVMRAGQAACIYASTCTFSETPSSSYLH